MVGKVIPYLGMLSLQLRTYTAAYPFDVNPWGFSNGIYPLDFQISASTTPGTTPPPSYAGHIFDFEKGLTRFEVGGALVSPTYSYGKALYMPDGTFLVNAGNQGALSLKLYGDKFHFDFGVPVTRATAWQTLRETVGVNTGFAAPYAGAGLNAGCYSIYYPGYNPALTYEYEIWDGTTLFSTALAIPFSGAVNGMNLQETFPLDNANVMGWNAINAIGHGNRFLQTDFATYYTQFDPTYINPTGFDVDTFMQSDSIGMKVSSLGFIAFNKTTQTIDGVTLDGFMIRVLPNLSGYYIYRVEPRDATAATWTGLAGSWNGKFDRNNILFMINQNFATLVLYGTLDPIRQNMTRGALFRMKANNGFYR